MGEYRFDPAEIDWALLAEVRLRREDGSRIAITVPQDSNKLSAEVERLQEEGWEFESKRLVARAPLPFIAPSVGAMREILADCTIQLEQAEVGGAAGLSEIMPGWVPIAQALTHRLLELRKLHPTAEFRLRDVKEKWGQLRVSLTGADELSHELHHLSQWCSAQSVDRCAASGQVGRLRQDEPHVLCLSDEMAAFRHMDSEAFYDLLRGANWRGN